MAGVRLSDYPQPSVAADIVVVALAEGCEDNYRKLPKKQLEVLMIKRGGEPYQGSWALPGGFLNEAESAKAAAARELYEETGIESGYLEQMYAFCEDRRDPRGWVISCAYLALVSKDAVTARAGDDAADAGWFTVEYQEDDKSCRSVKLTKNSEELSAKVQLRCQDEPLLLESNGFAFDHAKILVVALERLRERFKSSNTAATSLAAFSLLSDTFTLTDLQQTYEVILGRTFVATAFRHKIASHVIATDQQKRKAGHRPSRLYTGKGVPGR